MMVKYISSKPHVVQSFDSYENFITPAMHLLAAASRPRLSETEPKYMFETSCYAFVGQIRCLAKVNVNKVNICYCIVLILVASCSFRCTLSLLTIR